MPVGSKETDNYLCALHRLRKWEDNESETKAESPSPSGAELTPFSCAAGLHSFPPGAPSAPAPALLCCGDSEPLEDGGSFICHLFTKRK